MITGSFFASNGVEPRCLNENGERGKREVGEVRAAHRQAPDPAKARILVSFGDSDARRDGDRGATPYVLTLGRNRVHGKAGSAERAADCGRRSWRRCM